MSTSRPIQADAIGPDDPIRLAVAADLAFPDGGMTAAGLRREAARGRPASALIAGKNFTTLAAPWSMAIEKDPV